MAIENEIVRFIAEMELDPQDVAKFQKGLESTEAQCAALRKTISETASQMSKLQAEGKANSYAAALVACASFYFIHGIKTKNGTQ